MAEPEHQRERDIDQAGQREGRSDQRAEDQRGQDIDQVHAGEAGQPQRCRGARHQRDPEQRERDLRALSLLPAQDAEGEKRQHVLERGQRMQEAGVEIAHALDAGVGVSGRREQREPQRAPDGRRAAPEALPRLVSRQGP